MSRFQFLEGKVCVERCYSGFYVESGGERVCVGNCTVVQPRDDDPPDTVFCARETPCPGDRYFHAGNCVPECSSTSSQFTDEPTKTCV